MNDLIVFKSEEFGEVRVIEIENEPWFVGKDVVNILEYQNGSRDINLHVEEEDRLKYKISTSGQLREQILINESGLYSLILKSKLPQAKQFKRWVTHDVLPNIRKHGAYMTDETLEKALTSPDFLIKLATELKSEKEKNLKLQEINSNLSVNNAIMQPKADYFDELVDRNLLTNIRETAKQLQVKEKIFVKFLLDKKYLYRDKRGKLLPYADKNKGLFEIKESVNEKTNWSGTQTLITPKGRETFRLLFIN